MYRQHHSMKSLDLSLPPRPSWGTARRQGRQPTKLRTGTRHEPIALPSPPQAISTSDQPRHKILLTLSHPTTPSHGISRSQPSCRCVLSSLDLRLAAYSPAPCLYASDVNSTYNPTRPRSVQVWVDVITTSMPGQAVHNSTSFVMAPVICHSLATCLVKNEATSRGLSAKDSYLYITTHVLHVSLEAKVLVLQALTSHMSLTVAYQTCSSQQTLNKKRYSLVLRMAIVSEIIA